jgi:hypothetical protein
MECGMPSIKTKQSVSTGLWSKSVLILLCSGLIACGGGSSGTTRISDDNTQPDTTTPESVFKISVRMPMQVKNSHLRIQVVGDSIPLYDNQDFSDFDALVDNVPINNYRNKLLSVKLTGLDNSTMFEPILKRFVPFHGEINAIAMIQGSTIDITLSPFSEAIYQRTLVRAGNLDPSHADLTLIEAKHLSKARSEVNASLNGAFDATQFPLFNTDQSIRLVQYSTMSSRNYINIFTGLGLLNYWIKLYPKSQNTYLELAQSLGTDLRDGSLDGRTFAGDNTDFSPLITAPKNIDPALNTLLGIGETQKTTRESFGNALKTATLDYANTNFQSIINPEGLKALQNFSYYSTDYSVDTASAVRWSGAGDYHRAFGFSSDEKCQGISAYPCKQGLNADDTGNEISAIDYLIGIHQVGSCKIEIFPNGNVRLTQNNQVYNASINRDVSDNLLRLDQASQHYILNIGAGENMPPYFMQLEIKNVHIISAKTGNADGFYPTELTTTEMSCT